MTDSDFPCVSRQSEDGREGARRGDDHGEGRGCSEGEGHDETRVGARATVEISDTNII